MQATSRKRALPRGHHVAASRHSRNILRLALVTLNQRAEWTALTFSLVGKSHSHTRPPTGTHLLVDPGMAELDRTPSQGSETRRPGTMMGNLSASHRTSCRCPCCCWTGGRTPSHRGTLLRQIHRIWSDRYIFQYRHLRLLGASPTCKTGHHCIRRARDRCFQNPSGSTSRRSHLNLPCAPPRLAENYRRRRLQSRLLPQSCVLSYVPFRYLARSGRSPPKGDKQSARRHEPRPASTSTGSHDAATALRC